MKKNLVFNYSVLFSLVYLVLFEVLAFALLEKSIFGFSLGGGYFNYLIGVDILLSLAYYIYGRANKFLKKGKLFKLILPMALNFSAIVFLYFSFSFALDQVVIGAVFVSNLLLFWDIENAAKGAFKNLISFFVLFLFSLAAFNLFYSTVLPYWLLLSFVDIFLVMILYSGLREFNIERNALLLFLIIFAVLVSELFLFSFFIPNGSLFIKSLFMVLGYYSYWSLLELNLRNKANAYSIAKNVLTFVALIISVFIYSYLRGGL